MEKLELLQCGRRNDGLPVAGCRARRLPEAQDHGSSSSFRVLPASSLVQRRRTAAAAGEKVQVRRTRTVAPPATRRPRDVESLFCRPALRTARDGINWQYKFSEAADEWAAARNASGA